MKKTLAALTAVAIAASLSLAAFVAPASAAATPTPAPVASSAPSPTPSAAASSAPSSTATPAPSSTPTSTPTPATTPTPASTAPAPTDLKTQALVSTYSPSSVTTNVGVTDPYVTVVWQMINGGATASHATYPQKLISETPEPNITLDVPVPADCGLQYQVDAYVVSDDLTALLNHAVLNGPNGGDQDGQYLAYPKAGQSGPNPPYKLVLNSACVVLKCLPYSSVSYTYSHNDANQGEIVVTNPNPKLYTNSLCNPFYVTAASWKYTGGSTWPQVIDKVDKLGAITGVTTGIPFSAAVSCGQGDIYASTNASAPSLNPDVPGYLTSAQHPIAENFLSDLQASPTNFVPTTWTGSTWIQDSNSCWAPPAPSDTVAKCGVAGSANTLTLPAVPGGIWSYTVNGQKTALDSGKGLAGFTPTVFGDYTIELTQDTTQHVFTVTPGTWTWSPLDTSGVNCATTLTPVKPDSTPITLCDVAGGSITIVPAAGIDYYVGDTKVTSGTSWVDQAATTNLTGTVNVTAKAEQPGYNFGFDRNKKPILSASWSYSIGNEKDCTFTPAFGDCIPTAGVSNESVTLTFSNPENSPADVKVTGGSITGTLEFSVPANATAFQQLVDSTGKTGDVYSVTVNGVVQSPVNLTFSDCLIPVIPADPTFVDTTCSVATSGSPSVSETGSISTDANPVLTYTLTGPGQLPGGTKFPASGTITGLSGGDYVVSVVSNNPNYVLGKSVPKAYPVTITLSTPACGGTNVTPAVSSADTCAATGIQQPVTVKDATLHTDVTYVDGGVINLGQQPGILVFKINGVVQTASVVTEPKGGPYNVTVALTSAAVAGGYSLTVPVDSSVPGGFGWSYTFTTKCPLPTLAVLPWSVTQTSAECTTSGAKGSVTVTNTPGELGTVLYTITNSKGVVVATTTGTNTYSLAPGSYTVRAVPSDPADFGLTPNTGTTAFIDTSVVIARVAVVCGDTSLAFTGGTIAWAGFALAGGMLFLGIAFLLIRRRGNRTAE